MPQAALFGYLYSESLDAHQHVLNYCIYVFQQQHSMKRLFYIPVCLISQWSKRVGQKHRMEAFIRFKRKLLMISRLICPDFNAAISVRIL